jgi:hypothetical protein
MPRKVHETCILRVIFGAALGGAKTARAVLGAPVSLCAVFGPRDWL